MKSSKKWENRLKNSNSKTNNANNKSTPWKWKKIKSNKEASLSLDNPAWTIQWISLMKNITVLQRGIILDPLTFLIRFHIINNNLQWTIRLFLHWWLYNQKMLSEKITLKYKKIMWGKENKKNNGKDSSEKGNGNGKEKGKRKKKKKD